MKKKKGFTLIELIVSLLIFGLASAGIAVFYASNSKRIMHSEKSARMEVAAERVYEGFKGVLMERMYDGPVYSQLVFDSIWVTYDVGDTVFTSTDIINGLIFDSEIVLDSFEFDTSKTHTVDKDDARTFDAGSRIWVSVRTKNLSDGDSMEMQTVFSHHR